MGIGRHGDANRQDCVHRPIRRLIGHGTPFSSGLNEAQ